MKDELEKSQDKLDTKSQSIKDLSDQLQVLASETSKSDPDK